MCDQPFLTKLSFSIALPYVMLLFNPAFGLVFIFSGYAISYIAACILVSLFLKKK